jgi:DNA-binding transcriptional LysR family regulator
MRIVIALAEAGSIAEAAVRLETSRAKLRRKLAAVEEAAGTQLLTRVEGVLIPTRQGASFIEGARRILTETSLLLAHTRELGTEPTGVLTLGLQPGFPHHLTMAAIDVQRQRFPRLRQKIRIAEDPVSLLPTQADIAIFVGEDREVPGCVTLTLAPLRWELVATEAYLAEHGTPTLAAALHDHNLLVWCPCGGEQEYLHAKDGTRLQISPFIACSNERYLLYLAQAGRGIAYIPRPPIPDPEFPDLVPVLTDHIGRSINVQLVTPDILADVPRVKKVLESILGVIGAQ